MRRTLVPSFSRAMISGAGQSLGRKSSKSFGKCHKGVGLREESVWTPNDDR